MKKIKKNKGHCELLVVFDTNGAKHLKAGKILAYKEDASVWSSIERNETKKPHLPQSKIVKVKHSVNEIKELMTNAKLDGNEAFYNVKTKKIEIWEQQ